MTEVAAMIRTYLLDAKRGRLLWSLALLVMFVFLIGGFVSKSAGTSSTMMVSTVLWAFVVSGAVAVAHMGVLLPSDRLLGRTSWLRSHALSPWQHRVAALISGITLVFAVCLTVGLIASLVLTMSQPDDAWRHARTVPLPQEHTFLGSRDRTKSVAPLSFPDIDSGATLELDVRPSFYVIGTDHVNVNVLQGGEEMTVKTPVRGVVTFPVQHGSPLWLAMDTPGARLRIVSAAQTSSGPSVVAAMLRLALMLAMCLAAVVPVVALASRFTSSSTAILVAFSVLMLAIVREPLLALASDLSDRDALGSASLMVRSATVMVPDLPVLDLWRDASLRRVGGVPWSAMAPAVVYALATSVLAVVPWPQFGTSK